MIEKIGKFVSRDVVPLFLGFLVFELFVNQKLWNVESAFEIFLKCLLVFSVGIIIELCYVHKKD